MSPVHDHSGPAPDDPRPRAAPAAASPVHLTQLGNAAVARLARSGLLSRTPTQWRTAAETATIVQLPRGRAWTSYWPPVQDAVAAYGQLRDDDLEGRASKLRVLSTALASWEDNQASRNPETLAKDDLAQSKLSALDALRHLIDRELSEIRREPTATASADARPSAPMRVGPIDFRGTGPFSRPIDSEPSPRERPEFVPAPVPRDTRLTGTMAGGAPPPRPTVQVKEFEFNLPGRDATPQAPKLPHTFHVTLHFTKPKNVPSIHNTGLIAGKEAGIGLAAEQGSDKPPQDRDPDNVYVVDPSVTDREGRGISTISSVASEAGGAVVVVIAAHAGAPDKNYRPLGSAQMYSSAPPLRSAPTSEQSVFSFALPMTPRTESGLAAFVNRLGSTAWPQDEIAKLVDVKLRKTLGMRYPHT